MADNDDLTKGTQLMFVPSTEFSAALVAMGIPFSDFSNPCRYVEKEGKTHVTWFFKPAAEDGSASVASLCPAFRDPEKWIKDNPEHPFGYALAAVRNYIAMQKLIDENEPMTEFKLKGGKIFYVQKNSEKYHKLIEKGLSPT